MTDAARIRVFAALLACTSALLLAMPAGSAAAGAVPVKCAELQSAMNAATEGEVLQLSEACETNVNVTNAKPFTLEGDASAVLTPKTAGTPILESDIEGVSFTLEGLTFENGSAEQGGAVSVESGKGAVTLRDNTFLANTATNDGGAVFIRNYELAASEPTVVEGNTFGAPGKGNKAEGFAGGAAYLWVSGPVRVAGNSFTDNEVTSTFGGGGGLDVETGARESTAPIAISGNTFTENRVLDSGGGAFISAAGNQTVALEDNVFRANRVAGENAIFPREGGGLAVAVLGIEGGASFHVLQAHNTFVGNSVEATERTGDRLAAGGGGEWVFGVHVQSTGDIFSKNEVTAGEGQPPEGGGLGVLGTSTTEAHPQLASFTAIDDLFLGNSIAAGGWGGAIYTGFQNGGCLPVETCTGSTTLALEDSTVYANEVMAGSGSEGGALWGSPNDSLSVANSIISGNSPGPEIFGYATGEGAPTFRYSDICQEADGPAVPAGQGDICANPRLEANGEETPASPTIDAGSNALVPTGLSTDLAGAPRIVASHLGCGRLGPATVDMGAFEYQHVSPAPRCAPPVIANASQSHRTWREGTRLASFSRGSKLPPLGTTFSFTLDEPASVTFAFTQRLPGRKVNGKCDAQTKNNRHKHACNRTVIKGRLSFAGHNGTDKLSFQGRISRSKKLPPGKYTLVIVATNGAGQHSAPKQLTFTILK